MIKIYKGCFSQTIFFNTKYLVNIKKILLICYCPSVHAIDKLHRLVHNVLFMKKYDILETKKIVTIYHKTSDQLMVLFVFKKGRRVQTKTKRNSCKIDDSNS